MLVWTQPVQGLQERPACNAPRIELSKINRRAWVVAGLLPAFPFLIATLLQRPYYQEAGLISILAFLLMTICSKWLHIKFRDITVDMEPAAFLASVLVIGPFWTVMNSLLGIIYYEFFIRKTLFHRDKIWMNLFNFQIVMVSCGVSSILYAWLYRNLGHGPLNGLLWLSAASLALIVTNHVLVSLYFAVLDQRKITEVWQKNDLFYVHLMFVSYTPIGFLTGTLFLFNSAFLVLLVPLFAILYHYPKLCVKIKSETQSMLELLGEVVDERDELSLGRASRVAEFTRIIAYEMSLKEDQVETCVRLAKVRDVGKIAVHDHILHKNGIFTQDEYRHIQEHVRAIPKLFPHMESFGDILQKAMLHHERYDGSGYPYGLKGRDIPLEARIVAVADAWTAMTSRRVYRGSLPEHQALQNLLDGSGIKWDPKVVQAFMNAYERGEVFSPPREAA